MFAEKLAWAMVVAGLLLISASAAFATEMAARTDGGATAPTRFTSIAKSHLKIDVRSACTSEGVVFKIVNRGKKWPRTARLKLYNIEDNILIGERRLRLASLQQVSFIISDKVNQGKRIGVWVEPEWYQRPFAFDAQQGCSLQ